MYTIRLNKIKRKLSDFKNKFDSFRKLYKQFEDRMRPLVYELGFLLGDDGADKIQTESITEESKKTELKIQE